MSEDTVMGLLVEALLLGGGMILGMAIAWAILRRRENGAGR